jgi:hypothetical protein
MLLMTSPFAHSPNADPLLEAYDAFVSACEIVKRDEEYEATLNVQGWESYAPMANDPMGKLVSFLASEKWRFEKDGEASVNPPIVLRRKIQASNIELMIQEIEADGVSAIGCRAWDFDPPHAPSLDDLVELKVEKPTRTMFSKDLILAEWGGSEDGIILGSQAHFIPPNSPAAKAAGASGLSFKISFARITEE